MSQEIINVQLGYYLKRLRAFERRKPANAQRDVPTVSELADIIGVNPNRLFRLIHGHTRSLNFDMAADIMVEMWKRGFDTEITDILRIERPPSLAPKKSRADDPWAPPPPPLTRRQRLKYPGDEFVKAYAESESTVEEE